MARIYKYFQSSGFEGDTSYNERFISGSKLANLMYRPGGSYGGGDGDYAAPWLATLPEHAGFADENGNPFRSAVYESSLYDTYDEYKAAGGNLANDVFAGQADFVNALDAIGRSTGKDILGAAYSRYVASQLGADQRGGVFGSLQAPNTGREAMDVFSRAATPAGGYAYNALADVGLDPEQYIKSSDLIAQGQVVVWVGRGRTWGATSLQLCAR